MSVYIKNIYRIPPNSSKIVTDESSGIVPKAFHFYLIHNVGRSEVVAETIYGTAFGWIGSAGIATLKPKEVQVIDNGGRPYYRMGLKIHNKSNIPAIVCAEDANTGYPHGDDRVDPNPHIDYDAIVKKLVVFGIKFVPYVGSSLSALLKAFWPEDKPNVWEQVRDRVQNLVDNSIRDSVNAILNGEIRHYQERIKVFATQMDSDLSLYKDFSLYYMNLAQDLIGLELKFTYPEDKYTSFVLLPLYTAVVMMKMNYYITGVTKAQELGINNDDVEDIKNFATRLIDDQDGVVNYINKMHEERLDYMYETWDVKYIYNGMMNTRSFIAVNGLEYIPIWKSMLTDPSSIKDTYIDAVSYSEFHGRASPKLFMEATPEKLFEPLTPQLINGKRNKMTAVELYMWRINRGAGAPKICGLKVFFENGDSYKMGGDSNETHYVDFKGAYLTKLRVTGDGALDLLTFYFSDGREETYGTKSNKETVFEMTDHYIAAIFVADDDQGLGGQAANVAVSYLQI